MSASATFERGLVALEALNARSRRVCLRHCIDAELAQTEPDAAVTRRLFERAVSDGGSGAETAEEDDELWQSFIAFERSAGHHEFANHLVWRRSQSVARN